MYRSNELGFGLWLGVQYDPLVQQSDALLSATLKFVTTLEISYTHSESLLSTSYCKTFYS